MLRLCLPSAAEEGLPLGSPAQICSQTPSAPSLSLSKAKSWGLMPGGRAGATGEQSKSSRCSPGTPCVPPAAALPPRAFASFPLVLALLLPCGSRAVP